MKDKRESTPQRLFRTMLDRIRDGQWPIGSVIPSERTLVRQFGVSRISLRESLSMLRALGILDVGQGRGSTVRRIDSEVVGRLLPLVFTFDGRQTFEQVFEIRLAMESWTAWLAALRRTEDDLQRLDQFLDLYRQQVEDELERAVETDLAFHLQIARASGNPLFPLLLEAISDLVTYVQTKSCKDSAVRRRKALRAHESIVRAIRRQHAEAARQEMESHLRYSAERIGAALGC